MDKVPLRLDAQAWTTINNAGVCAFVQVMVHTLLLYYYRVLSGCFPLFGEAYTLLRRCWRSLSFAPPCSGFPQPLVEGGTPRVSLPLPEQGAAHLAQPLV